MRSDGAKIRVTTLGAVVTLQTTRWNGSAVTGRHAKPLNSVVRGMDDRLRRLISAYQAAVKEAVQLLAASGIPMPQSNMEWAANGIPQRGEVAGGVAYVKHGYGCVVHLSQGSVDFDFGDAGQTNGFDAWRLTSFASDRLPAYGFESEEDLKEAFERAVSAGELVYSGYILHYLPQHAA